jgi:hypothetical protein
MHDTSRYIDLSALARTLGLSATWLKREADAGRIPCLRAGRRRMFDLAAVLKVLAERQTKGGAK